MGEMRIYNFCPERTGKILKEIYKTFKQTGAVILKQYDVEENKESTGYYYKSNGDYVRVKCCKNHSYFSNESEITTIIKYKTLEEE